MKNLDILDVEQGSPEWFTAKLGVISASNAKYVLAKKGSDGRNSYMSELIAQIATGEMPEINARAMEWGKSQEAAALSAYEFTQGKSVERIGFIYGKERRTGCSPDAKISEAERGVEIKCPYSSKNHIDFLAMEKIKTDYLYQVQFSMWVTGFDQWDFCSFDPRMKKNLIGVFTIERDKELMERFENEVPAFIKEMDAILDRLEIKWGSQWE